MGLLILTVVSPVGVIWNVLRKALACRLTTIDDTFEERTRILSEAFGPHLTTISGMTRSVTDWVHDNVMNPAYLGVMLTVPMVVQDLGDRFDVLGSSPSMAQDWRWFKTLAGAGREFNDHFLSQYYSQLHNLMDYRLTLPTREVGANQRLEAAASRLCDRVGVLETAMLAGQQDLTLVEPIVDAIDAVLLELDGLPDDWALALRECASMLQEEQLVANEVAQMELFRACLWPRNSVSLPGTPPGVIGPPFPGPESHSHHGSP